MRAQYNRIIQRDVQPRQPIAQHGIRASQRIKISNSQYDMSRLFTLSSGHSTETALFFKQLTDVILV